MTSTSLADTTTSSMPAALQDNTAVYDAGDAETVTVPQRRCLTVTAVDPVPGWSSEIERAKGAEVEVRFLTAGRRIDFKAELEDGEVKVRVRSIELEFRGDDVEVKVKVELEEGELIVKIESEAQEDGNDDDHDNKESVEPEDD